MEFLRLLRAACSPTWMVLLLVGCGQPAVGPKNEADGASSSTSDSGTTTTDNADSSNGANDATGNATDDAAGDESVPTPLDDSGQSLETGDAMATMANDDAGACNAIVAQHPIEGATHVAVCSPVTYATKPPSSGNHYPIWAAYQTYASAIPEGFWVHDLEHGAVVVSYNCPSGCADQVADAQAWISALPDDPI